MSLQTAGWKRRTTFGSQRWVPEGTTGQGFKGGLNEHQTMPMPLPPMKTNPIPASASLAAPRGIRTSTPTSRRLP
jgi:hypothetical protein